MTRTLTQTLILILFPVLMAEYGSVIASEAECAAIRKAMVAQAEHPAVRNVTTIAVPGQEPFIAEAVATGSDMFIKQDGVWHRMGVTARTRRDGILNILDKAPLRDCRIAGTDVIGGEVLTRYEYVQPDVSKEGLPGIPAKLWIDATDGLPRRLESPTVVLTMDYKDVVIPTPKNK